MGPEGLGGPERAARRLAAHERSPLSQHPEISAQAWALHDRAIEVYGWLTPRMQELAGRRGLNLVGRTHWIKHPKQIAGKIERYCREYGRGVADAATSFHDTVRYCFVQRPDDLAATVTAVLDELAVHGVTVKEKRNYFREGNRYLGFHVIVEMPAGSCGGGEGPCTAEIQFHTDESLAFKSYSDTLYRRYQQLPGDDPERASIFDELAEVGRARVTIPGGLDAIAPPRSNSHAPRSNGGNASG